MENTQLIPVVLLNWNGSNDTIDCLNSLYQITDVQYSIIVADNFSTDQSVADIENWLIQSQKSYQILNEGEKVEELIHEMCYLLKLTENYGFAKGNNLAIQSFNHLTFTDCLVLNNDTEVNSDFLVKLKEFKKYNSEYKVLTPLITYHSPKDVVWNAGGRIFFGFRKYYYADKPVNQIKEQKIISNTFVTGCALYFDKSILQNGNLFTERFFFGEEDFEFALRMKKQQVKMACLLDSRITHKVSSSTSHLPSKAKIYLHYLNRFIDIRINSTAIFFQFWKLSYYLYLFLLLSKNGFKPIEIFQFIVRLNRESISLEGVSYEKFKEILKS